MLPPAGPDRDRRQFSSSTPDAGVVLVAQLGMTGARVAIADLGGTLLAERFEPFRVKVGSVIGCGMAITGEVVRGAQSAAGNIGHIAVPGDATPCVCGNVGCLDAVAGGRALVTRLQAAGLPVRDVPHLVALAREGVPEAAQAVRSRAAR